MISSALKNLRIRVRLLLLCLAVTTPLVAMCGLIIWKEYQGLVHAAHRAATFHDAIAIRTVAQWIKSQESQIEALALMPEIRAGKGALTNELLTTQVKVEPDWNALALYDLSGRQLAASIQVLPESNSAVTKLPIWKAAVATHTRHVSGYVRCPLTGEPAILVATPVYAGHSEAVLIASIRPQAILKLFDGLGEVPDSVICVVDQEKRCIARTLNNDKWTGKDFSHAKTVTAASRIGKGTIEVVGMADPTPRTYAFDRVPGAGWIVIVGIPTQAIYGSAHDRLGIMILCAVLAIGSSVVLAYAFTGHFTGPIHELVREAVAIGRGDLSKRVGTHHGGGELGLLSRAFNQMAINLELNREHKLMIEKISESVRQSLDLDQILNTAVLELGRSLSASRCCLALVDDTKASDIIGKQLEFNYVWFDPDRIGTALKNRSIVITEGSILKLILEQRAILSLDMMKDKTFTPLFEAAEESPEDWTSIKSLIACPIVLNQQPVGMILVHQCDVRRNWIDLELELVEAVARHVALAMDHAGLFAKTKTLAEQESLINHIVRAVRTSLDPDTILSTVTEELGKALNVDHCQIAQPRPEGPLVVTHEFHAANLQSTKGLSLYGSKIDFHPGERNELEKRSVLGIDLKALEKQMEEASSSEAPIAIISDVSQDRRAGAFREFLEAVGSKSLIAAPLLRDDRVLGMLIVHQTGGRREWQAGEVRLLAAVADQLAVAISHAQLFAQVKHQSITDGLTSLYNHIYFKNRLAEELNRAQRKSIPCSLLMIDLDKLKEINDTYGHPVGDAAIRQVSLVLRSLLRSGDTAARYGGEEFAVILPETPLSEALMIADRLRRNINRHPVPGLGHISASIGAACFPSQSVSPDDLIDKADRALYFAKRSGRNRVCVWDDPQPIPAPMDDSAILTRVEEDIQISDIVIS